MGRSPINLKPRRGQKYPEYEHKKLCHSSNGFATIKQKMKKIISRFSKMTDGAVSLKWRFNYVPYGVRPIVNHLRQRIIDKSISKPRIVIVYVLWAESKMNSLRNCRWAEYFESGDFADFFSFLSTAIVLVYFSGTNTIFIRVSFLNKKKKTTSRFYPVTLVRFGFDAYCFQNFISLRTWSHFPLKNLYTFRHTPKGRRISYAYIRAHRKFEQIFKFSYYKIFSEMHSKLRVDVLLSGFFFFLNFEQYSPSYLQMILANVTLVRLRPLFRVRNSIWRRKLKSRFLFARCNPLYISGMLAFKKFLWITWVADDKHLKTLISRLNGRKTLKHT